jgi:hypothetical protein
MLAQTLIGLLSLVMTVRACRRQVPLCWKFAPPVPTKTSGAAEFQTVFDYTSASDLAHSPAIALKDQGFSLIWFEGPDEAQADVDILSVDVTQGDEWQHSAPKPLLTPDELGRAFDPAQQVITLGNAIENEAAPGGFYTTVVSLGGWAMASVAAVRTVARRPVTADKLNLSPLLNRSHLVKSPMLEMADGSFALPAYFEMGQAYAVLVRLHPDGRVRDTRRIPGRGVKAIQPMIIALDQTRAVAFLRNLDAPAKHLLISRTLDGGQSWSPAQETEIESPNSPVAALALGDNHILMAVNDEAARGDILRLMLSTDGGNTWRRLTTLEEGGGDARYPMLRRLPGGDIILTYSHSGKRGIRAHVFNETWVRAQ